MFQSDIIDIIINIRSRYVINIKEKKSALQYIKLRQDFKANRLAKCHRFAATPVNVVNLMIFRLRPTKPQITMLISHKYVM